MISLQLASKSERVENGRGAEILVGFSRCWLLAAAGAGAGWARLALPLLSPSVQTVVRLVKLRSDK